MAVDLETVEKTIVSYVADVKAKLPIEKAYLYGSYAKGSATEQSDIDICFFLQSFEDKKTVDIICDLLYIARKYPDFDIEPKVFRISEIARGNPFVKEILKTGREITV